MYLGTVVSPLSWNEPKIGTDKVGLIKSESELMKSWGAVTAVGPGPDIITPWPAVGERPACHSLVCLEASPTSQGMF